MWTFLKNLFSILAVLVPRWTKARDQAKNEAARKAITTGDKEAVNRDFQNLLKLAFILIIPLAFTGCSTYTVISADREMIPLENVDGTFFKAASEGGTVHGWFVPTAVMLEIRNKLATEE